MVTLAHSLRIVGQQVGVFVLDLQDHQVLAQFHRFDKGALGRPMAELAPYPDGSDPNQNVLGELEIRMFLRLPPRRLVGQTVEEKGGACGVLGTVEQTAHALTDGSGRRFDGDVARRLFQIA